MVELLFKKIEENLTLNDKHKDLIKANVQLESLKPKELFIQKGEVANKIGFIIKGVFRHFYFNEDEQEITLHFMKENDFITNVSSFMEKRPSTGVLQSETLSQIIVINRTAWNLFTKKIPGWEKAMASFTNDALVGLVDFLKLIIHRDATSSYETLLKQYPTIAHRVPLSHIATLLGIKQSTLSRLRKQIF